MTDPSPLEASHPAASSAPVELEWPDCPVCGGTEFELVLDQVRDRVWDKPGRFRLERCRGCGLVLTRPRPTAEGLGFYYDGTYTDDNAQLQRFNADSFGGRWLFGYRVAVIGKVQPLHSEDHILDVGCSYGGFLAYAVERFGCRGTGIDLDSRSIDAAVSHERVIHRVGTLREAAFDDASFSVVTLFQTLEHTADPVGELAEAYRVLRPGGLCVVEVPDFGGWWRPILGHWWLPLLVPQHLVHFDRATLHRAVDEAGFDEVALWHSMMLPVELTTGLGLYLRDALWSGREPTGANRLLQRLLAVGMVVLWGAVEVPVQLWLRIVGRAGHQVIVARKAAVGG